MNYSKLQKIILAHSYVLLLGFVIDFLFKSFIVTPFVALVSFLVFTFAHQEELKKRMPIGGWANVVTLTRLSAVFWIAFNHACIDDRIIGLIAVIIVSMDGLDGFLARRQKTVSEFGAYIDMETDAFFVAMMSYIIYLKHPEFVMFLIPGLMRYIYLVLIHILGAYGNREVFHAYSKWFAVAYFIAVIAPFLLPLKISYIIMILAGMGILYSFLYSFVKLFISLKK